MSTVTKTIAKGSKQELKNKEKDLKEATSSKDIDDVLRKVKDIDNVCSFDKCKNKTNLISIDCKYCHSRFCTTHGLPEVHGCGEAVKRDERRQYVHPEPKLSQEKHQQAQTKLAMKLKQMQLERKSKQGFQEKGKKKK
ncbi:DNA-binding protein SMUBP-2 [Cylas formicarius]|uniref:DNA-binding protein SMUBP-2 n=1 Tax=Cylas formicarius TaxID=197179 RepID=UPI002958C06B|nr:DNA-binding protein SMUBP-2 [Cylas formicarius]